MSTSSISTMELRMERLIELLETLLERESSSPLAERLDRFLEELERIEVSMERAARIMQETVPRLANTATKTDIEGLEDRTALLIETFISEQRDMRAAVLHLITTLGLPPHPGPTG